ncbi:MAG: hypothetical protein PUD59_01720 [bacterium]|nr:hypothetical protein [bacterium]
MSFFKNDVGRPSNKTLEKRRLVCFLGVILVILLIVGIVMYFKNSNLSDDEISGSGMNVTINSDDDDIEDIIDPKDDENLNEIDIVLENEDDNLEFKIDDNEWDEWDE